MALGESWEDAPLQQIVVAQILDSLAQFVEFAPHVLEPCLQTVKIAVELLERLRGDEQLQAVGGRKAIPAGAADLRAVAAGQVMPTAPVVNFPAAGF